MLHSVERRLLVGAGRPAAVGTLCVAAAALAAAGPQAGLSAVLGGLLVGAFFGLSLVVSSWTRRRRPRAVMGWVMATYAGKIVVLGILLAVLGDTELLDTTWFAGSVLVVSLVWLGRQVQTFTRLRVLYIEPEAGAETPGRSIGRPV